MVKTTSIESAHALIKADEEVFANLGDSASDKGLIHLNYLSSYWVTDALWKSWSDYGRHIAGHILKCPFEGVLPTTNHLESFNGILKNKHLKRWQRSGRRLRVDVLIKVLIMQILPAIFLQRSMEKAEKDRFYTRIHALPGGSAVLTQRQKPIAKVLYSYHAPDPSRDVSAASIIEANQISTPVFDNGSGF